MNRHKTKTHNKLGFSMIELAIAITIIATLVGVISQGGRIVTNAKLAVAKSLTKSSPVADIDGLVLWLETTMPASFNNNYPNNGDAIENWYDLSPDRTSVTQSNSSYRPVFSEGVINDLPAVKFDGTNDWIDLPDTLITDPRNWTTFVVADVKSTPSGGTCIICSDTTWRYYISYNDSNGYRVHPYNSTLTPSTTIIEQRALVVSHSNAGDFTAYFINKNSAQTATITKTTSGVSDNLSIGSYSDGSNSFFNGYIGEIVMFNRSLVAEEQKAVRKYLEKKWDLYDY
jgi:prepilin-type N-terminal cleavage/methylation domain-containing protein